MQDLNWTLSGGNFWWIFKPEGGLTSKLDTCRTLVECRELVLIITRETVLYVAVRTNPVCSWANARAHFGTGYSHENTSGAPHSLDLGDAFIYPQ